MPEICLRSLRHTGTDGFSPSAPFSCPPFSVPFVPGTDPMSSPASRYRSSPIHCQRIRLSIISCGIPVSARYFLVSSSHIPARLVPCLFVSLSHKESSHILYGSCASLPTCRNFRKHLSGIRIYTSNPKIKFPHDYRICL